MASRKRDKDAADIVMNHPALGGAPVPATPAMPATGTPVAGGSDREKVAFDYFVSQGHSPAAAAGIVGNLVQESGLNPAAVLLAARRGRCVHAFLSKQYDGRGRPSENNKGDPTISRHTAATDAGRRG